MQDSIDVKSMGDEIRGVEAWLNKFRGIKAMGSGTLVYGLAMKIINRHGITCKEVIELTERTIKLKKIEELSQDEVQLLLATGFITKTKQPFEASPKVGRNDTCLCGSGKKYKLCCMDNIISLDKMRYIDGKG